MVNRSHLGGIGYHAGIAIPDEGIRFDAVPQRLADIDEFLHAVVARTMLHQFIEAIVLGIGLTGRGDDIEGYAPVTDVIERIQ